jgi:hypothetical protein
MIVQEKGYLGTFPQVLEPEDTQAQVISSTDAGPFWMSSRDKDESRLNQQLGTVTIVKLKALELKAQLAENGWYCRYGRKNARQLKNLCVQHGIPTIKTVSNSLERNRSELEMELRDGGEWSHKERTNKSWFNCASNIILQQ